MMTDFYTKVLILSRFHHEFQFRPDWEFWMARYSVGTALSFHMYSGWCQVSEDGMSKVNESFDALLDTLDIVDTGIDNLYDLLDSCESGKWHIRLGELEKQ